MARHQVAGRRPDRGSVSVEMTMLVWPVAVLMAAFIAGVWVLSVARHDVSAAAGAAARAASQQYGPQAATTVAQETAQTSLESSGRACTSLTVPVNTSQFTQGGWVEVTVECTLDLSGLAGIEVPGEVTFQATARAPIETFRELEVPRPAAPAGAGRLPTTHPPRQPTAERLLERVDVDITTHPPQRGLVRGHIPARTGCHLAPSLFNVGCCASATHCPIA